ncbi:MAG: gamma-glutamyltransferase [Lysobacterales bacterium]
MARLTIGICVLVVFVAASTAAGAAPADSDVARAAGGATLGAPGGAAIASANGLATDAGMEILAAGGNAFDAAVAVTGVLAVVEPTSSGLGGGALMLLHRADGFEVMLDGRETAPAAAKNELFWDKSGALDRDLSVNGPLAAGIPGEPAALVHLAAHYGKLPLASSLAPAIRIARNGFPVYGKFRRQLGSRLEVVRRYPHTARIFLTDGKLPDEGFVIRQPDLQRTLESLAKRGNDGFYRGEVARKLVRGVRANGGVWTERDLASYRVVEREPIRFDYRGYRIVTAPSPSSGGVLLATMLNTLSGYDLTALPRTDRVHVLVEIMRRVYRDRAQNLGDADFVDAPFERLLSPHYAAGLRAGIRLDRATPSAMLPGIETHPGGTDTSHFSIIDSAGNIVAATVSVNLPFGSAFMSPGTGVVLNNEMDDFALKAGASNAYGLVGNEANAIEPGKRPLSSMTPTLVIGANRVAVLGTPGGSRIISMVLLGILDFIDGASPADWVAKPRLHHQYLPDAISAEAGALSAEEMQALRARGHTINESESTWGNMQALVWDRRTGALSGGTDPRGGAGKVALAPAR